MNNSASESNYIKMTETPVWKLILTLGLPTTVSMLVTNIYNMADTYFVSTLGNSAGGATSIVFSVMAILQAFGFMFGHGAGSHISRLLGAKNEKRAGNFVSTALLLALLSGAAIMVFGLLFLEPLMLFLGSTSDILPHAKDYARFIFIAAPAMTTSCVLNNVLRYEGKATFAMIGLTSGGILNILFDYIAVMRLGMGTQGAGIATALSQYIGMTILLAPFITGKTQSKIGYKRGFISARIVWDIITTGLPSLIRQGLSSVSVGVLNIQAKAYGSAAIAAMGYVSKTVQFIFCVGLGIGQGFQPVSAFNYGAKKYSRVKKGSYFTMIFGFFLLGGLAAVCYALAPYIIALFNSEGTQLVTDIGVEALRMNCYVLWTLPATVVGNMMFQSIGKKIPAILLSALQNGIAFIPLIYLMPYLFDVYLDNGLLGLEMAQPTAYIITAAITLPCMVIFLSRLPGDGEKADKE